MLSAPCSSCVAFPVHKQNCSSDCFECFNSEESWLCICQCTIKWHIILGASTIKKSKKCQEILSSAKNAGREKLDFLFRVLKKEGGSDFTTDSHNL